MSTPKQKIPKLKAIIKSGLKQSGHHAKLKASAHTIYGAVIQWLQKRPD